LRCRNALIGQRVADAHQIANNASGGMMTGLRFLAVTVVATGAALGAATAASAQDADAGKKVFAKCMPCHNADKPQNKVGPTLVGLFGREAGSVEGYKYSEANKASHVVWTAETLNEYLKDPKAFIPGTKMVFAGLKSDEDRANLIAYLEQATATQ
jgi:cytochrome c